MAGRHFRRVFLLAVLALFTAADVGAQAAATFESTPPRRQAPVPFAVGEELVFRVTVGKVPAGTARMRVQGIDTVRGRAAYHVVFTLDGGIPFFRVNDLYESWIDTETLSSLRYRQVISQGRYRRNTTYELFPERAEYQKNGETVRASVAHPLDEGSFIYAARVAALRSGDTLRTDRYFIPDRNPVVLAGRRQDTVKVGAGTYVTTVIHPSVGTQGMFAGRADAEVWFTNDARRLPVQVKTRFSRFSLVLTLESATFGDAVATTMVKR